MTAVNGIGQVFRIVARRGLWWTPRISWTLAMAAWLLVPPAARADFTENFDAVTPPALPASWIATNADGPDPLWVTTATDSDSAPNNAFVDCPGEDSDKRLDSPSIPIATISATLTFRHSFNFGTGDGGVLEISFNNEEFFQDITAVNGTFTAGQYNGSLALGPLGGRFAWTGNSGGYITTSVNLPITASANNIVLRFRMASDSANAGVGWHIDSFEIESDDRDSDIVANAFDNCPDTANTGQENSDGDARGDVCDNCPYDDNLDQSDEDDDGIGDVCDNCPATANADQADLDSDGIGDACDNCPIFPNADQADADEDGIGDACECGECGSGFPMLMPLVLAGLLRMKSRQRRW